MKIIKDIPEFSSINVKDIYATVNKKIAENTAKIAEIVQEDKPTWDNTIKPLDQMHNDFSKYWSIVSHLHSVDNKEDIREQYKKCLPVLSEYYAKLGQNKKLFKAMQKIHRNKDNLQSAQVKYLEDEIRDFKLSGVDLSNNEKEQLTKLQIELSDASNKFQENVLDATQKWQLLIKSTEELSGLTEQALQEAKAFAKQNDKEGYLFNLDHSSFISIMRYADDRTLRSKVYYAYITRASDVGPMAGQHDNTEVMHDILERRQEIAKLLGFANYAEYSIQTKMTKTTSEVVEFLENLLQKSKQQAEKEINELQAFASKDGINNLEAWDLEYYREKYKQAQFNLSQEEIRQYFPVNKVLSGLFAIVNKLFGLQVEIVKQDIWHKDVIVLEIQDSDGLRGYIYADLYARENKRGGAWMDECRARYQISEDSIECPMAYLTCNFTRAFDTPLLKHDEVITLFHEFGHCLHHVLTSVDVLGLAGINGVPWDGVELPSQFLENWCWEYEALKLCSSHVKTGEELPREMFDNLYASKNYHAAIYMLRQLEFSLFDFKLHLESNPADRDYIQKILDTVRQDTEIISTPEYNRFQNSFSHIFAGGYAAGYYSYKWAEVLSCDAFDLFLQEGIFNRDLGKRFESNILSKGGSEDFSQLYAKYRGQEPTVDALLRQSQIAFV